MNQEQIKKILDDAPEGATHVIATSQNWDGGSFVAGHEFYAKYDEDIGHYIDFNGRYSKPVIADRAWIVKYILSDLRAQLEPESEPTEDEIAKVRELRAMLGFTDGDMIPCGVVAAVAYDKICELMQPEQEWKNGDACNVEDSIHDEIVFIGLAGNKSIAVCECITSDRRVILDKFWLSDLRKPETEAEKAAREREEAAYDLYCYWCDVMLFNADSIEVWREDEKRCNAWLNIVDKTDYIKEPTND